MNRWGGRQGEGVGASPQPAQLAHQALIPPAVLYHLAYGRNLAEILLAFIALLIGVFRFPASEQPDLRVFIFLGAKREYR